MRVRDLGAWDTPKSARPPTQEPPKCLPGVTQAPKGGLREPAAGTRAPVRRRGLRRGGVAWHERRRGQDKEVVPHKKDLPNRNSENAT